MTETVEAKARRLVDTDAIQVLETAGDLTVARVAGDTGTYRVTRTADGAFEGCSCPAVARCSHIAATEIVTTDRKDDHMDETHETDEMAPDGPETADPVDYTDVTQPATATPESSGDVADGGVEAALMPLADAPVTYQTLRAISRTEFVPKALRGKPDAVLAAVLYGRELGLGPMQALAHVHVVDGRPAPSSELLLRLIREAGHSVEVLEASDRAVRLRGTRSDDGQTLEVSFTLADADRAGLVAIDAEGIPRARSRQGAPLPWEAYTPDLLWARAVSRLHRRLFPDVTRVDA